MDNKLTTQSKQINDLIYINSGLQYSIEPSDEKTLQLIIHPNVTVTIDCNCLCWCSSYEYLYYKSRTTFFQKIFGSKTNDVGLCDVVNATAHTTTTTTPNINSNSNTNSAKKLMPIMCGLSKVNGDRIYEIKLTTDSNSNNNTNTTSTTSDTSPNCTHKNTVTEQLGEITGSVIRDGIYIHREVFLAASGEFVHTIGKWKPWQLYTTPPTREVVEQFRLLERRQQGQNPGQNPDQAGNGQNANNNAHGTNAHKMYDSYYFGGQTGSIFIQSEGAIVRKSLALYETLMVEQTCLVGHSSDCILSLTPINTTNTTTTTNRNAGLGGVGGGYYYVTGPGFVYLSSHTTPGRLLKIWQLNQYPGGTSGNPGTGARARNFSPMGSLLMKMILFSICSTLITILVSVLLHMYIHGFSYNALQDAINELLE